MVGADVKPVKLSVLIMLVRPEWLEQCVDVIITL
jgi:hypothetical protein